MSLCQNKEACYVRFDKIEEMMDAHFIAIEKMMDLRFESAQTAVTLARVMMEGKLETMNEFRTQILSERKAFATRDMLDGLAKIVYIGLGIVLALEFALKFFVK
jgi:hypothetical protein